MKIPVSNSTAMPIYVGAAMIPPGETRHFDEQDVPPHLRPAQEVAAEPEAPADPLAELLKGNVASVVAALPGLSVSDVERLGDMEQADLGRKGVLGAIAEQLMIRAENTEGNAGAAA